MELHIFLHVDNPMLTQQLEVIQTKLNKLIQGEDKIMATVDDLVTAVGNESTVDDSIIALLAQIKAMLDAGGLSADAQAKVDAVFAQMQSNIQKVTAAVTANTPAAPPTPTP